MPKPMAQIVHTWVTLHELNCEEEQAVAGGETRRISTSVDLMFCSSNLHVLVVGVEWLSLSRRLL